jgi:hypothetical protein
MLPIYCQLSAKAIGTQPPKKTKVLPANAANTGSFGVEA